MNQAFPGNRPYTHNTLVEELALTERHMRDGSWKQCTCNPEKHLPLIAGLASEGSGFAESPKEKSYMKNLQQQARQLKQKMKYGATSQEAEQLRSWARKNRLAIENQTWTPDSSSKTLYKENDNIISIGGRSMAKNKAKLKKAATIYGGNIVGEVITVGLDQVDAMYPGAVLGYNPSIAIDAVGAILGLGLNYWNKVKDPWDIVTAAIGGYLTADLIQKLSAQYLSPALYVPVAASRTTVYRAPASTVAQGALGKYS